MQELKPLRSHLLRSAPGEARAGRWTFSRSAAAGRPLLLLRARYLLDSRPGIYLGRNGLLSLFRKGVLNAGTTHPGAVRPLSLRATPGPVKKLNPNDPRPSRFESVAETRAERAFQCVRECVWSRGVSPLRACVLRPVTESYCVAVRRGGKLLEVKDWSVTRVLTDVPE